jgi:transcriptional regulator with XRE-family HTH domain
MLRILKIAMLVLDLRARDVERQLGVSGGYLSRIFSGDIALRHDLIVDFARALGLEPWELIRAAYPEPAAPPSRAAAAIQDAALYFTGAATPASLPARRAAAATAALAELEAVMLRAASRVFQGLAEGKGEE